MRQRGVLALLAVTAIWGTTFPTMKLLGAEFSAMQIIALRFGIAVAVLLPLLPGTRRAEWRWGLALGVLLFFAFALQIEGLMRTSSNRNAFITGLNVLLVPVIGLALGQRAGPRLWLACLLALLGTRLLFWEGGGWSLGDTLTLASTLFYAAYIHVLGAAQRQGGAPLRALHLAAVQGVAMLAGALAAAQFGSEPIDLADLRAAPAATWLALLHLGLAASIGSVALQAWGQRHVPPTPSAIIFGLEPVFAALTALALLGERLAAAGIGGGALIVAAVVLSQLGPASEPGHARS